MSGGQLQADHVARHDCEQRRRQYVIRKGARGEGSTLEWQFLSAVFWQEHTWWWLFDGLICWNTDMWFTIWVGVQQEK